MSLLANSNAIESGGYNIDRSLRFRSSASAYLNRTPASAGNRKTWTFSAWVKRGALVNGGLYNNSTVFSAGSSNPGVRIAFDKDTNNDAVQVNFSSGTNAGSVSTSVYRDVSAWYHIVVAIDTTQATASNRVKIYINNNQVTSFNTTSYPNQNTDYDVNNTVVHNIGRSSQNSSDYFDGYLAEVNFIDGQALTPSSFGYTDPVTGVWQPLKYSGTYGTNGFYLPFNDPTSATTLAYDKSGNGNNWTPNNISTTAGATYDSMTDVPTLTSATAANYCTLNPLASRSVGTMQNGNLTWKKSDAAGDNYCCVSTMSIPSSGKWYWELTVTDGASGANSIGIVPDTSTSQQTTNTQPGATNLTTNAFGYYSDGNKYTAGSGTAYGSSYTTGDVIGVAVDTTNGKIWWAKNGTWQASGDPAAGTNAAYTTLSGSYYAASSVRYNGNQHDYNFGQRPFSYTPPTGFKALNTFNLPDPTIKKPNQFMDATLYTGTGATQNIVNAGGFQPNMVWVKDRSRTSETVVSDSVRGTTKQLFTPLTNAEQTDSTMITAFNSNGFRVGDNSGGPYGNVNYYSGDAYVGWQWKQSATAGFDIQTFTASGTSATVNHNLGVTPDFIILKRRDSADSWFVNHSGFATRIGYYLTLNSTASVTYNVGSFTAISSSSVSLGGAFIVNGATYVMYAFSTIAGFSKFGSYTGNGAADGPFVYCGFRPRYIMIKQSSAAGEDWIIQDTARKPYNDSGTSVSLYADSSAAEVNTASQLWDVTSNGFKLRASGGGVNTSGGTYLFTAFAENPFKYSLAR